jgi:hypothetical protein
MDSLLARTQMEDQSARPANRAVQSNRQDGGLGRGSGADGGNGCFDKNRCSERFHVNDPPPIPERMLARIEPVNLTQSCVRGSSAEIWG